MVVFRGIRHNREFVVISATDYSAVLELRWLNFEVELRTLFISFGEWIEVPSVASACTTLSTIIGEHHKC